MEEEKKTTIDWVECKLGYDPSTEKVKLSCKSKDDFAKATGYLLRMSLEAAKGLLLDEAKKEEKKDESSESSK